MSSGFNEREFGVYLAEAEDRNVIANLMMPAWERLHVFLAGAGVEFADTADATPKLAAQRERNRDRLAGLAASIAIWQAIEAINPHLADEQPDYKKRLQAEYMVQGFGGAWLELIDEELPGEPLADDDFTFVAEVAAEAILKKAQDDKDYNDSIEELRSFLTDYGLGELDGRGEMALSKLTTLRHWEEGPHGPKPRFEDAQQVLYHTGLKDSAAWQELVLHFFNA